MTSCILIPNFTFSVLLLPPRSPLLPEQAQLDKAVSDTHKSLHEKTERLFQLEGACEQSERKAYERDRERRERGAKRKREKEEH